MENPSELEAELVMLTLACALLSLATLAAVVFRRTHAVRVGRPLASERARPLSRWVAFTFAAVVFAAVVVHWEALPRAPVTLVLVLALAALGLAPALDREVVGERGVSHGWQSRSFSDVEEWRLTGEHLRWRLHGTWRACRVPAAERERLRAELARLCPERESAFKG